MEASSTGDLEKAFPLLDFPVELQMMVLSELPLSDLLFNVAPVSRHLSRLCRTNKMWMLLFTRRWGRWTPEFDNVLALTRDCSVGEDRLFSMPRLTGSETMEDEDDDDGANERPQKRRNVARSKLLPGKDANTVPAAPNKEPAAWKDRYRFFLARHWTWVTPMFDISSHLQAGHYWLTDSKTVSSISVKKGSKPFPGLLFPGWHLPALQVLQIPGVISRLAQYECSVEGTRHAEVQQISCKERLQQLWQAIPGEYHFGVHIFEKGAREAPGTLVEMSFGITDLCYCLNYLLPSLRGVRIQYESCGHHRGSRVTISSMVDEISTTRRGSRECWAPFVTGDRLSWTLNLRKRRFCFQRNGKDQCAFQLSDDLPAIAREFARCRPGISLTSRAMLAFPWALLEINDESGDMPGTLPLSTPHRCMLDEGDDDDDDAS